jgi:hypothetical protein
MFSELRKKEIESGEFSQERLAFEFFFEERIWFSSATLDTFKISKFQDQVMLELQNRILKRD